MMLEKISNQVSEINAILQEYKKENRQLTELEGRLLGWIMKTIHEPFAINNTPSEGTSPTEQKTIQLADGTGINLKEQKSQWPTVLPTDEDKVLHG